MQFNAKPIARWAVTLVCGALGVTLLMGPQPAYAAVPTSVTAVTHIANDGDQGSGGAIWAIDQIDRTLTVTQTGTDTYSAVVSDTGTFTTQDGALTPNQVINGQVIANVVSGKMACTALYTVVTASPLNDTSLANGGLPTAINDAGAHLSTGPESLSDWPEQAFTPVLTGGVSAPSFSCTYVTAAGEQWVDSSTSGDGGQVSDGNITGLQFVSPVLPRLSKGHAVAVAPTREDVYFTLSGAASCVHFMIAGPGQINGHEGWVPARLGLNAGVYSGLEAGHTYLVFFTPVTSCGSQDQVPGTRTGHVTFVS